MTNKTLITVTTLVEAPVETVWKLWTTAVDIRQWNNPFDDWHSPRVEVDLREEGRFYFRMETIDGSTGFDHAGRYEKIIQFQLIEYAVNDGRKTSITFSADGDHTLITECFEP